MTDWRNTTVDRPEMGRGLRHGLDHFRRGRARGGCCGLGFRHLDPARAPGTTGDREPSEPGQPVSIEAVARPHSAPEL